MAAATESSATVNNLWQKFHDIGTLKDQTLQENRKLQQEIESCRERQTQSRQNRAPSLETCRRNQQQQQQHEQPQQDTTPTTDAQDEYTSIVQPAYVQAQLRYQQVTAEYQRWKNYQAHAVQTALEESRHFRATARRLRWQATVLGIAAAPAALAAAALDNDDLVGWAMTTTEMSSHSLTDPEETQHDDPQDPTTWNISEESDDELYGLYQSYSQRKQAYDAACAELHQAKQKQQQQQQQGPAAEQQQPSGAAHQPLQRELLEKQLDRIVQDSRVLESEIKDLENLTEAVQAQAQGFEERELFSFRFVSFLFVYACTYSLVSTLFIIVALQSWPNAVASAKCLEPPLLLVVAVEQRRLQTTHSNNHHAQPIRMLAVLRVMVVIRPPNRPRYQRQRLQGPLLLPKTLLLLPTTIIVVAWHRP